MTTASTSNDECALCYGDGPTCPVCPLAVSEHPILTDGQCAQLGISAADAADAAAWARAYGPLTDEQRERLRAVVFPYVNGR